MMTWLTQVTIATAVIDIMAAFGVSCLFAKIHSSSGRLLSLIFFSSFIANIFGTAILLNPDSPFMHLLQIGLQIGCGSRVFFEFILIAKWLGMAEVIQMNREDSKP